MNKKDKASLAKLEKQVEDLRELLVKHHNLGNLTLYVPFGILGISLIASGLIVLLSSLSPIAAAMPLIIVGIFALVYSFYQLVRKGASSKHQNTRKSRS